jgi:hypothetical protein
MCSSESPILFQIHPENFLLQAEQGDWNWPLWTRLLNHVSTKSTKKMIFFSEDMLN